VNAQASIRPTLDRDIEHEKRKTGAATLVTSAAWCGCGGWIATLALLPLFAAPGEGDPKARACALLMRAAIMSLACMRGRGKHYTRYNLI